MLLLSLHVPQPRLDVLHLLLQVTLLLPQVLHVLPEVEVLLSKAWRQAHEGVTRFKIYKAALYVYAFSCSTLRRSAAFSCSPCPLQKATRRCTPPTDQPSFREALVAEWRGHGKVGAETPRGALSCIPLLCRTHAFSCSTLRRSAAFSCSPCPLQKATRRSPTDQPSFREALVAESTLPRAPDWLPPSGKLWLRSQPFHAPLTGSTRHSRAGQQHSVAEWRAGGKVV